MESAESDTYQDNVSFVHNGTNETAKYFMRSTVQFTFDVVVTSLMAVTGLVGLVGNVLVFRFARSRKRRQQQPTRFAPRHFFLFIQSLALSDILTCAIAVPLLCASILNDTRTEWFCKGIGFLVQLFPVITIYNLLVVSLERYLAIRRPMYCLSEETAKRLVKLAWAVGTALTLIIAAMVEAVKIDVNDRQFTFRCKVRTGNTTSRTLLAIFAVCFYLLPIAFIIFTSASIIEVFWRREMPATTHSTRRRKARKKATKLLVTIVVAFVISYTPLQAILTYRVLVNDDSAFPLEGYVRSAAALLVYANSAVNVFIHLMFLPGFYQSFKRIRQSGAVADTPV